MKGLGHSGFSNYYGISSLLEARAYLENLELGYRLRTAVNAMADLAGIKTAEVSHNSEEGIRGAQAVALPSIWPETASPKQR